MANKVIKAKTRSNPSASVRVMAANQTELSSSEIAELAKDVATKLDPKKVKPPKWLHPKDHEAFHDLCGKIAASSVLSIHHVDLVATCAQLLMQMERCSKIVIDKGMSFETETKEGAASIRIRPEYRALADSQKRVHALLTEFGLSPLQVARNQLRKQQAAASAQNASAGGSGNGKFSRFKRT